MTRTKKQKLESCIRQVKMKSKGKVNPFAVCKASLKKKNNPNPIMKAGVEIAKMYGI